jgi:hypothetical protein
MLTKDQGNTMKRGSSRSRKRERRSNVPKILEAKRLAEKERDEFRTKVEEYETTVKPGLEAKINELQSKIDSGDYSSKKEVEFQNRITELETRIQDERESLVSENTTLKKKLELYDVQNSEYFQKTYLEPIYEAHNAAVQALNEDERFQEPFRRVLTANAMVLQANTPENKRQAIIERNNALSSITEELDEYSKGQFIEAIRAYFHHAEQHQKALIDSEKTSAEAKRAAKEAGQKAYADHLQSWTTAFKAKTESYKEDEELDDNYKDSIKDLHIDIEEEMKRSNLVARKTIAGETDIHEAIDIVHKGRVYPVLKAKLKALEKQVKDKDALIAKLRASGTDGGADTSVEKETKPDDREEFYNKFRPGKKS